jgi:hypothetical protein
MMNGIPGSPPHGYFQVKRAVVAFNTFVDCRANLSLGLVSNNPQGGVLPPKDCTIANNVVWSDKGPLVHEISKPMSLRWQGNILHGAELGVRSTAGIVQVNPKLQLTADGIWRPTGASAVLGGAVGSFPFVSDDIDGQPRGAKPDIGCDQVSDRAAQRRPLSPDLVGPTWRRKVR